MAAAVTARPRVPVAPVVSQPPPAVKAQPQQTQPQITCPDIVTEVLRGANGESLKRRYKRGRFLGKGGFAQCYALTVLDTTAGGITRGGDVLKEGDTYAGKVVTKRSLTKGRAQQKLLAEIRIHRALKHKHIVRFVHYFEDVDNVYIILELCDGRSLADLMRREKRLTSEQASRYLAQILDAVRFCHSRHVIHRDLKLGNLFLNAEGDVKIGDFGLACHLEHKGERKNTICGTPNYIAPEVLSSRDGHSFEVDIWSTGVIAYTMLVGRPPFETADVKSTYRRIRANAYSFPANCAISSEAKELIRITLQQNPDQRPTVQDLLDHPFIRMYNGAQPNLARTLSTDSVEDDATSSRPQPRTRSPLQVISNNDAALEAAKATLGISKKPSQGVPTARDAAGSAADAPALPAVTRRQAVLPERSTGAKPQATVEGEQARAAPAAWSGALPPNHPQGVAAAQRPASASSADDHGRPAMAMPSRPRPQTGLPPGMDGLLPTSGLRTEGGGAGAAAPVLPCTDVRVDQEDLCELTAMHDELEQSVVAHAHQADRRPGSSGRGGRATGAPTAVSGGVAGAAAPRPRVATEVPLPGVVAGSKQVGGGSGGSGSSGSVGSAKAVAVAVPAVVVEPAASAEPVSEFPSVWVCKWADYSNKYGLGYQLSNGSVGVLFNDYSKIILAPDRRSYDYIVQKKIAPLMPYEEEEDELIGGEEAGRGGHQNGGGAGGPVMGGKGERDAGAVINIDERTTYSSDDVVPRDLHKKHTLLHNFEVYLRDHVKVPLGVGGGDPNAAGVGAGNPGGPTPGASGGGSGLPTIAGGPSAGGLQELVYVKKWIKTRRAIIFRLSNRTVQVDFNDFTEIILSGESRTVSYVDKELVRSSYSLSRLPANPGLLKRLKYAKEILFQLISRSAPAPA